MKNTDTAKKLTLLEATKLIADNAAKIQDIDDLKALGFEVDVIHQRAFDLNGIPAAKGGRSAVVLTNVAGNLHAVSNCTSNEHFVRIIGRQTAIARIVDNVTGSNTVKTVYERLKHLIPRGKADKTAVTEKVDVSAPGVEKTCCGNCI